MQIYHARFVLTSIIFLMESSIIKSEVKTITIHEEGTDYSQDKEGYFVKIKDTSFEPSTDGSVNLYVIMAGQIARDVEKTLCTEAGKEKQIIASKTQVRLFEELRDEWGYNVKLILSTNSCDAPYTPVDQSFGRVLKNIYGEWLIVYHIDSCDETGSVVRFNCRQQMGIQAFSDINVTENDPNALVVLNRPDLHWYDNQGKGAELVAETAKTAWLHSIAWPFTCEEKAWKTWQCVADTLVVINMKLWKLFNRQCVRHITCYGEEMQDEKGKRIPSLPFDDISKQSHPPGGKYSGHGCFRCAVQMIAEMNTPNSFHPTVVKNDSFYNLNTRSPAGKNPYYYFGGG